MALFLHGRPSKGHQHGVSIQSSVHLVETLFGQWCEWKTAQIYIFARLFMYQSSIISHILDLVYWMFKIFIFDGVTAVQSSDLDTHLGHLLDCQNK